MASASSGYLVILLENMPAYWADFAEFMFASYADARTEEGRAWLWSRSPLHKVDQICRPSLIAHGVQFVVFTQSLSVVGKVFRRRPRCRWQCL